MESPNIYSPVREKPPQGAHRTATLGRVFSNGAGPEKENFSKGFTLIEILVVVVIIGLILSMGLITSFDSYRGYTFRSERAVLVSTLEKARSHAINNVCLGSGCTTGKPHGVHIGPSEYVIFQGATYLTRDTAVDNVIARNSAIQITGPSEVIFDQLTGDLKPQLFPTAEIEITITQDNRISTTTINNEGTINW